MHAQFHFGEAGGTPVLSFATHEWPLNMHLHERVYFSEIAAPRLFSRCHGAHRLRPGEISDLSWLTQRIREEEKSAAWRGMREALDDVVESPLSSPRGLKATVDSSYRNEKTAAAAANHSSGGVNGSGGELANTGAQLATAQRQRESFLPAHMQNSAGGGAPLPF